MVLEGELAKHQKELLAPACVIVGVDVQHEGDEISEVLLGDGLSVEVRDGGGLMEQHGVGNTAITMVGEVALSLSSPGGRWRCHCRFLEGGGVCVLRGEGFTGDHTLLRGADEGVTHALVSGVAILGGQSCFLVSLGVASKGGVALLLAARAAPAQWWARVRGEGVGVPIIGGSAQPRWARLGNGRDRGWKLGLVIP